MRCVLPLYLVVACPSWFPYSIPYRFAYTIFHFLPSASEFSKGLCSLPSFSPGYLLNFSREGTVFLKIRRPPFFPFVLSVLLFHSLFIPPPGALGFFLECSELSPFFFFPHRCVSPAIRSTALFLPLFLYPLRESPHVKVTRTSDV